MKDKRLKRSVIMLAIGLALSMVACLIVNVIKTPTITEQEFHYSVTYKLNGEIKTLEGIYTCSFDGYVEGDDPRNRYYVGEYTVDGQTTSSHTHTIAERDGATLYIVTIFNNCYLMGDTKALNYKPDVYEPFLEASDKEGYLYGETELPGCFDAEIISWEYPEPIENTFVFSGFSILHTGSMVAMLVVGLLMIVACLAFVRRDKTVPYKALDKVSIVLNIAVVFVAIPVIAIVTSLFQITLSGDDLVYQYFLCTPALTAFGVAASVALRRMGFTKSGFFVQFVGPVLFLAPVVMETVISNIFG
jgi:hypothetical protein